MLSHLLINSANLSSLSLLINPLMMKYFRTYFSLIAICMFSGSADGDSTSDRKSAIINQLCTSSNITNADIIGFEKCMSIYQVKVRVERNTVVICHL